MLFVPAGERDEGDGGEAEASASVAASLDIKQGELVVVRRSQRFLGNVPWLLVAAFFPMDLARGTALEQAGTIEQGSIKLRTTARMACGRTACMSPVRPGRGAFRR